jgi:CRISPR type I-E-associated protein CasB/Cse2
MSEDRSAFAGSIVARWARSLHPDPDSPHHRGDVAARARLRRAATPAEALADPACVELVGALREAQDPGLAHRLERELDRAGRSRLGYAPLLERIGTLAAVLAAADRPARRGLRFATALGRPGAGDQQLYTPIRFTALLNAEPGEAQLRALRRAATRLRAADRSFDVPAFASDLLRWGDRVRIAWTFQYHQEALATPASAETESPE